MKKNEKYYKERKGRRKTKITKDNETKRGRMTGIPRYKITEDRGQSTDERRKEKGERRKEKGER